MLRRNLRLKTAVITSLAGLLILAGLAVGAVRLIDHALPGYRADLAAWAGLRLGQPLTIGGLGLGWTWSGPVLRLEQVVVPAIGADGSALRVKALALGFSFWDLVRGRAVLNTLELVGPRLVAVRSNDGGWRVRGLGQGGPKDFKIADITAFLDQIDRIEVQSGAVGFIGPRLKSVLWLRQAELLFTSHDRRHRLIAEAQLPPDWGQMLSLDVAAYGPIQRLAELEVHASFSGQGLAAARVLAALGAVHPALQGGASELELTVDWVNGALAAAQARMQAAPIRIGGAEPGRRLSPPFRLELAAQAAASGYRLRLESLRVSGEQLPTTAHLRINAAGERLRGEITQLPAAFAAALARVFGPDGWRGFDAGGVIDRLHVDAQRGAPDQTELTARVHDFSLSKVGAGFYLGRVDGHASWGRQGASVQVDAAEGKFTWERYMVGSLPIEAAQGKLVWTTDGGDGVLRLSDFRLAAAAAVVTGGGSLRLPEAGGPWADLEFSGHAEDAAALLAHIPQGPGLPFDRLREWLPRAVLGGRASAASVRLRGALDAFPFPAGEGLFQVVVHGQSVGLDYKPGWPAIHDITGQLSITGVTLEVEAQGGTMLGVELGSAQARVADVREPVLKVTGAVPKTAAAQLLQFIPASPLADKFGRLVEVLQVQGKASLDLDLLLPLKAELGEPEVAGKIRLYGVRLQHEALPTPIKSISGVLRFDLEGLYADDVRGLFAGLPILVDLAPVAEGVLAIDADAFLDLPEDAQALGQFVPPALLARAAGKTMWHAQLTVSARGKVSSLTLTSDLQGMALRLPAPLGKRRPAQVPVTVTVAADRSRASVRYAGLLDLALRWRSRTLVAIDAIFGGVAAAPPPGLGLWVGGRIPVVEVPAWRRLIADFDQSDSAGGGEDDGGLGLRGLDLEAGAVRVDGQRIPALAVRVAPLATGRGWEAVFSGTGAAGTARWVPENGRARLRARLEHLAMRSAGTAEGDHGRAVDGEQIIDPAAFPALDIQVQNLVVEGRDLGRLSIAAVPVPEGIRLERLALQGNEMTLAGEGSWVRVDGKSTAQLTADLHGSGLGDLLVALGYKPNITAQRAQFDTALRFAPDPQGLQPGRLNGSLSLHLEDGTLVPVEPGAARLLGLLNFYALPRRLLFDFRDVLGKGLAFDSLTGDFRIEDGVAHTKKLRIDTPAAIIRIEGSIDLAARTYDQKVTIVPKVSTAAAIAAAVIGGPVVGAAIFVAQRVFDRPLSELSDITYRLTGSWDDPQIEPLADETQ